jgi:hypothetical protein
LTISGSINSCTKMFEFVVSLLIELETKLNGTRPGQNAITDDY